MTVSYEDIRVGTLFNKHIGLLECSIAVGQFYIRDEALGINKHKVIVLWSIHVCVQHIKHPLYGFPGPWGDSWSIVCYTGNGMATSIFIDTERQC
jgi:hypothetical protein